MFFPSLIGACRQRLTQLGAALLLLSAINPAGAQDAGTGGRFMKIIVPWAAGGGSDAIARAVQPGLREALGQSVIIENMPGAGGVRGWRELAKAQADGQTIAVVTSSILITKHIGSQGVDYRDYELLLQFAETPMVFVTSPTGQYGSLGETLAFAKANPERLRLGTAGLGTMWHIAGVGLERRTESRFQFINYKGGSEVTPAIMGHHIDGGIGTLTELTGLLGDSTLKPIAMFSDERHPAFPNVPTLKEQGIDFSWSGWWGFLAPKGIAPERLRTLREALSKAITSADFKKYAESNALTIRTRDREEFMRFMSQEDGEIAAILNASAPTGKSTQ